MANKNEVFAIFSIARSRNWAFRNWEGFGFDYDPDTSNPVLAWSLHDDGDEALAIALRAANIHFTAETMFKADFANAQ